MRSITIAGREINQHSDVFIVAEIGHNHGGDIETALKMCKIAKDCGCDAVKLQKRTIDKCFTKAFLATPYNSEHAFGPTYGEHRRALEFGRSEYERISDYCKRLDLIFFATAFDEDAADFLESIDVPVYKIASGDLTNLPLIDHVARKGKPMIISTGGAGLDDIRRIHERLGGRPAAFLHCVAIYPTPADKCNLRAIETLYHALPGRLIGYSCHYNGIAMAEMAFYFGAQIIEKHFTLDHTAKGSDHALSLQPDGMRKMVRDLRRAREALGTGEKTRTEEEVKAVAKMGKSLWPTRHLATGHTITEKDLAAKTPIIPGSLEPYRIHATIGKVLINQVSTSAALREEDLLSEEE